MIFRRARIRLALSFAALQLLLFAAFAVGVYAYVSSAFDVDAVDGESATQTAEAAFATLRSGLVTSFAVLVVVVPVTSYLLSGLAMRPVLAGYEAQQRFVDDASHELRTPLSAVLAQLELGLSRTRSGAEYRDSIGRALASAGRLESVLDDLLALSRSAGDADAAMRPASTETIVRSALETLDPADAARVTATGPDVEVVIVESMIQRAVLNLIVNALRYSDATVTVTTSRRGAAVRFEIADSGIGMTVAEVRRAFDRFWRADPTHAHPGSGLGLPIVREIARVHAGAVDIISTPGSGTVVGLEIPLSRSSHVPLSSV